MKVHRDVKIKFVKKWLQITNMLLAEFKACKVINTKEIHNKKKNYKNLNQIYKAIENIYMLVYKKLMILQLWKNILKKG